MRVLLKTAKRIAAAIVLFLLESSLSDYPFGVSC